MYSIQFGSYNSYTDFGMYLTNLEVGAPAVKTNYVNIPARDGQVDLSSVLSDEPIYDIRTINYTFVWKDNVDDFEDNVRNVMGALHGQTMNVIHGNSPYYYTGKLSVQSPKISGNKGQLSITLTAYPYALKTALTSVTMALTASETSHTLTNSRMRVIPTFELTGNNAEATISQGSVSVAMSAGTRRFSNIALQNGENTIRVRGSGTLTVYYREGVL